MPTATVPVRLICVTPTRNESWIIDRFIGAARLWADDVIIADQRSTDDTPQRAAAAGAQVVHNNSTVFDESHRQRILLREARRIPGKRIMIALDADEALSANFQATRDWQRILEAAPGTVLRFRWANILPGFSQVWLHPHHVPFGFVDDGSEHEGRAIHSPRLPLPPNAPTLDITDFVILHFQYVVWERMRSKQRWYQAWEYCRHQEKGPLDIFRMYNHMHGSWKREELTRLQPEWMRGFDNIGIDFRNLQCELVTWWDKEIVNMLAESGPAHFRRIAIWDRDWNSVARTLGYQNMDLSDPRGLGEKLAHRLLSATQGHRSSWPVRGLERLLRTCGW